MISPHKYLLPLLLAMVATTFVKGQELNCVVKVNADQVQTTERAVFKDMETTFSQFMSTRRWTNDNFSVEERIKCNIIITITEMPSIGSFEATVQIQSARPIYNSSYETILLNFADRLWHFEYIQSQPVEFSDNNYLNNLSSLLAYFAYIVIGLDYDSFGELDGGPYFQKALNIANNAQQAGRPGWDQFGDVRNRFWLLENINNIQMEAVRKGLYKYHRLALDQYQDQPEESRKIILEVLRDLNKVKMRFPNSILLIMFFDAKKDELVNIFSGGTMQVKREAYDLLSKMDPAQTENYKKILN